MQHFDEISTVPGVTKQAIAEFLTRSHDPAELFLGKYRVIHTSGTSGELGTFVYSPRDWARGMSTGPRGPQPKRKCKRKGKFRVAYYGAIDGHYAGVTMLRSIESGLSKHFVEIGCFEVNSPLPEVIAGLNEFQPDYLSGYTNALKVLAQKQREGALKLDCLTGVSTAGEATTEADRAMLEQAFGCSLVNAHGCSEHLVMGASPPGASNIVLADHDLAPSRALGQHFLADPNTARRIARLAELEREVIDVQVDVFVHHLVAHRLRVLANKRPAHITIGERILDAAANHHDQRRQPYPRPGRGHLLGYLRHEGFPLLGAAVAAFHLAVVPQLAGGVVRLDLLQEEVRHLRV